MNWGKGIAVFIIFFLISMFVVVFIAFRQSNEMIEDHYYQRELKYQQVIDARAHLKPYLNSLICADSSQYLYIQLPKPLSKGIVNGTFQMIKMDNQQFDHSIVFDSSPIRIPKDKIFKGEYAYKLQWSVGDSVYFHEDMLYISK